MSNQPEDPAAWAKQQAKDALPCELHERGCRPDAHLVKCPAFNRARMVAALLAAEQRGAEREIAHAEEVLAILPNVSGRGLINAMKETLP